MPAGRFPAVRSAPGERSGGGQALASGRWQWNKQTPNRRVGPQRAVCTRLSAAMLFGCRQPCPCRRGSGGGKESRQLGQRYGRTRPGGADPRRGEGSRCILAAGQLASGPRLRCAFAKSRPPDCQSDRLPAGSRATSSAFSSRCRFGGDH